MNNDLISRSELKFEIGQQLSYHKEKAKLTTINADKMSHSLVATGIQLAIDIIDNAPTVEPERPKGACCGSCYLCDVGDCGTDMRKGGAE